MNFVEKLNSLIDPSLKNKFRYYEKLQNKIISQEYSIVFNEKYIVHLDSFSEFKLKIIKY